MAGEGSVDGRTDHRCGRREHLHPRVDRWAGASRRPAATRRTGASRPRCAAAGDRRRHGAADADARWLDRSTRDVRRPGCRPRRRQHGAGAAADRRAGGAGDRRVAASRLRMHRPGDDGRRWIREGAAHGAGDAGHRRANGGTCRARRVAGRLHQSRRDRHACPARRGPSGDRAVQRCDRHARRSRRCWAFRARRCASITWG